MLFQPCSYLAVSREATGHPNRAKDVAVMNINEQRQVGWGQGLLQGGGQGGGRLHHHQLWQRTL